MKVSVIVPTKERERFLRPLYECFCEQSYPDKELVVLDDSEHSSSFFRSLRDSRVRYYHTAAGMTLGHKRNLLVELAKGEVIAQFDDDDYYVPNYLDFMLGALGDAHLVKLCGWYVYMAGAYGTEDFFGYWDTAAAETQCYALTPGGGADVQGGLAVQDCNLFGYGFSYVFKKAALGRARFPHVDFAEDYELVVRMRDAGLKLLRLQDDRGLVLHMIHDYNCSRVFPQYRMPARWARDVFGDAVERYLPTRSAE